MVGAYIGSLATRALFAAMLYLLPNTVTRSGYYSTTSSTPSTSDSVCEALSMEISLNANLSYKNTSPSPARRCKYSGQSVRALPIRILTVGRKRSSGVQLLVQEYKEKLKYYCNVDDIQIRSNPKNTGNVKAQIEGEDMVVMQHIRSGDWVVVLDEHGQDMGSERMAELVGDAGNTGSSTLSFCIGGPYGLGRQLRERANVTIKLSSMVLNHQIALVVLLEQLYRAWTILKGQKYHH